MCVTMEQVFCALKQKPRNAILDMAQEWKGMGENLFKSLADYFSDIESREQTLCLFRESLEEEDRDLERRREELKLREEKLDEQLKSVSDHIESLEVTQNKYEVLRLRECEKLKEIEKKEREIESSHWSLEKRLREVEKREKEFDTFRSEKLRELALEEEVLRRKRKEFAEEVKLADEELIEKQKLGCNLIQKLELTLNMVGEMNVTMDRKFKEFESREALAYESLIAKFNEANLIQESLEKQFKELEKLGRDIILFHEDKAQYLESKEQHAGTMGIEILKDTLPEQCSKQLEAKKLNKIESQELTSNVAYETLEASTKDIKLCRESANKHLQESIAYKGQQLDCRTIESEGNIHDIQEFKEPETTDACCTIDPPESVDLKLSLQKDGKSLRMFMNGSCRDLELMDNEIFRVLLLSSDPAKFVLDAVRGLGKGSKELRVRREVIVLLDQLTKMSPNIEPCVRESAAKLSLEWKSTMTPTAENQLEVLGLLHLLAAYHLSSYFDKNELLSLVKLVAQHKQTPELCRILGLADKMHGFIQNLINEKQYLLASTYIYECGLENSFPQAAVLNYYVNHAKLSAKAKFRRKYGSSQAQDIGFASEIADLQVAIEHITKYGLESEYSPDILLARIKQLERNQASSRNRRLSADIQKQGNGKRAWSPNEREHEEAAAAWHFPAWEGQNQMSEMKSFPVGSHQHRDSVDRAPMRRPHKRRWNRPPYQHH